MDQNLILLTILGMTFVTYIPRLLPVWFLSSIPLPAVVKTWLGYVTISVLAALLFPSVLFHDNKLALTPDNLFFLASIPTVLIAWKTRSLFASVIIGMVIVAIARISFSY